MSPRTAGRSVEPSFIHTKYEKDGKTKTVKDAWPPSFGKPSKSSLAKAVKGREKSRPDEKVLEAEVKSPSGKTLARYKKASKIACPQDLQAELRHILAYCQGDEKPSRDKIASDLRSLAAATDPKKEGEDDEDDAKKPFPGAAPPFKKKTANTQLDRGKMGYTVTLSRVTGAKQVRPGPFGPVGGIYEYGLSVVVQFEEKGLTWIVVELEATCEVQADENDRGKPFLVVTDLQLLKESTRSGWGDFVQELMWHSIMDWDGALPLPF